MTACSTEAPAVFVDELVKKFGTFTAVDGLSFTVPRGEIFGFLGPNGAGKSTTIRMLCGILEPTSGCCTVAGFDVGRESEKIKEKIGYMSQKFSLYEDLTVKENIEFFGGVYGVTGKRMVQRERWILEMAGLSERSDSITGELSVGWKQRLALGCAVVHEPEILFLDEPTSGVDPLSRRNFWDLIYDVAGRGVTVFVTTHYMDEAEHCDRLGMIYRGKLISLGSPKELKAHHPAGKLLEVQAEPVMKAYDLLEASPNVLEVSIFGAGLHVFIPDGSSAGSVRNILESGGVTVNKVEPAPPSLEDIFVTLVERADLEGRQKGS